MSKVKQYKATAPKVGVALANLIHGAEHWWLYLLPSTSGRSYLNFKLVAHDYVNHKAAYWIGWSILEQRMCHSGRKADLKPLREFRPVLFLAVDTLIRGWVGEVGAMLRHATDKEWEAWSYHCTATGPIDGLHFKPKEESVKSVYTDSHRLTLIHENRASNPDPEGISAISGNLYKAQLTGPLALSPQAGAATSPPANSLPTGDALDEVEI